jgi:uncharacterized Ntn-hydrolase superfamily protein
MTFSVAGLCRRTGRMGAAITTSSPAVGSRCPWARAGVGVVLSQNVTDPRLGPQGLDFMAGGMDAAAALDALIDNAPHLDHRQLALLDTEGRAATYSGKHTLGTNATQSGADCVGAGNLLTTPEVPRAMVTAFESNGAMELPARLLNALAGGLAAGGEVGDVKSAALLVVAQESWPYIDLRVDWHDEPVIELARLWQVYAPQAEDYITRALDPDAAPSYGVPGNE